MTKYISALRRSRGVLLLVITTGIGTLSNVVAQRLGTKAVLVLFALTPIAVTKYLFIWQPVTYMFLHNGLLGFSYSAIVVLIFGPRLELYWGTSRFIRFYVLCGIVAGITLIIADSALKSAPRPVLGAGGPVFGIIVAYAVTFPKELWWRIPIRYLAILYVAIETIGAYSQTDTSDISHITNLAGGLFGLFYLRSAQANKDTLASSGHN
jgi:membrane associated rhomboid family serine protease